MSGQSTVQFDSLWSGPQSRTFLNQNKIKHLIRSSVSGFSWDGSP